MSSDWHGEQSAMCIMPFLGDLGQTRVVEFADIRLSRGKIDGIPNVDDLVFSHYPNLDNTYR